MKHVCERVGEYRQGHDADVTESSVALVKAAAMVGVMQGTVDRELGAAMEAVIDALLHLMTYVPVSPIACVCAPARFSGCRAVSHLRAVHDIPTIHTCDSCPSRLDNGTHSWLL